MADYWEERMAEYSQEGIVRCSKHGTVKAACSFCSEAERDELMKRLDNL